MAAAGAGKVNVLTETPAKPVREFERIYDRHYLNYAKAAAGERYDSVPESGSMLVICYDAFQGAIQPLVDWKNQMGVPTTLVPVSVAGSTGSQLKSYVQGVYDETGVTFVLLVGDGQFVHRTEPLDGQVNFGRITQVTFSPVIPTSAAVNARQLANETFHERAVV